MLKVKDLVFKTNNFVPAEHQEITLAEFKTSVNAVMSGVDKSGR